MSLITLDSNAYKHNLSYIATRAGGYDKLICVFKDNAYGHGICLLAPVAKACGVNFVAVKDENEAYLLEKYFDNILILSHRPIGNENLNFIYALNDPSSVSKFKKNTRIHLKIDTNMHRNGIDVNGLENFLKELCHLNLEGAFTHFMSADELDASYFTQKYNFQKAKKIIKNFTQNALTFHSFNSSALFRGKMPQDEMCRVGLVQFGYGDEGLKKVLRLYAHKLSSRVLEKGQSVGYGGAYVANEPLQIATYDLGYADGLFRYDGKGQLKLANGKEMLGKMSMDSFSCEDSGEEICVLDDANLWADFFHTINYEILVKLNANIKRVLV
ncbi:alanine racemase [Campylobacter upsaliensis]|nr:alanine racemase [Campylobacter upsaliensis]EAH4719817.1 alanine racemase [Campylobacter upsaliensis]EAH9136442.1 alanine racemase [Campylobacter upsaliensis]EAH9147185.1 alanine racemase [Campylobacter upsaliensis]EAI2894213.1 alanine racemase [Campylobacter upsaliensis]